MQMQQKLGPFPKEFLEAGKKSKHYFDKRGELKGLKSPLKMSISHILSR
jgi:hypothetical protein